MKGKSLFKKLAVALMIGTVTFSSPVGSVVGGGMATVEAATKTVALSKTKVSVYKGKTYKLTLKNLKKVRKLSGLSEVRRLRRSRLREVPVR